MTSKTFILESCSKAMVTSQDAVHLLEQKSRLEQAVSNNDPSLTLDTAKSLLESIFKTILSDRIKNPDLTQDFKPLYKNVGDVLALNSDAEANKILKTMTNSIVHNLAELRNKYGAASHGDDGYYDNPFQMPEAEMIAHIVDGVGGFLFHKHKSLNDPETSQRIYYNQYHSFNDWLDSQYDPVQLHIEGMPIINYSQIIFNFDVTTYREMLLQYLNSEAEDEENEAKIVVSQEMDNIQDIADALFINEEVRVSLTEGQAKEIALFVQEFALNQTGIDWQNRASSIAAFRNNIKRRLIKITFNEAFIDQVVDLMIKKAIQYYSSE